MALTALSSMGNDSHPAASTGTSAAITFYVDGKKTLTLTKITPET